MGGVDVLRKKLERLAEHATFDVVLSAVIGSAPPHEALEALEVVELAQRLDCARTASSYDEWRGVAAKG